MDASFPLLSVVVWLPLLGALALGLLPQNRPALYRSTALGFAVATLLLAAAITAMFAAGSSGQLTADVAEAPVLKFVHQVAWVPAWGISYFVALDGLSVWPVLLTALLAVVAVAASFRTVARQPRQLLLLLLLLETTVLGVFAAQDMLLFYIFFEATLVPLVLLIGIWGGEQRVRAATKTFVYTFGASVLMLAGVIGLYALHRSAIGATQPGYSGTFSMPQIAADLRSGAFTPEATAGRLLFGAFFIAFAVKMALWPFHSWLPDAYAESPTPALIMLAGAMSKLGTYGLLRFCVGLFPEAARWAAPAIGVLAVIGIIYGAAAAFAQRDMQRVIAYSSISHMNYIALGIFALNAIGISGALFQMVSHGIVISALLLVSAAMVERRQTRDLSALGGVWRSAPVYGGLTLLVVLASIGLPGLIGFVGEFTIMQGVLASPDLGWPFALGAVVGVVLAATYMLRLFRLAFMGTAQGGVTLVLPDLSRSERALFGLLAVPIIGLGLFPTLVFAPLQGAVGGLLLALRPLVGG